ncbi:homoserine kinase [Amphibacillus cookii]|uniref:homoserine kinase n=1 Tax=Amphibacillus cookii TaxID=767787 RepID=UPI00195D447D|nr:homoserine kinase [Amphibacillus cookii]MBM7541438.1 homoserine kinase [Amphibacillus cookii]
MSWTIKVPATTANLGAGFDSIGMAVNLFLTLTIRDATDWCFISKSQHLAELPSDETNFICQIAKKTAKRFSDKELPACHVELNSDIPLARGLGSSATAIAAGIELANQLLDLGLTDQEKVLFATEIEGHPDNVAPAILGGCVIGHYHQTLDTVRIPIHHLDLLTLIPPFELKTSDARAVLPNTFSYHDSIKASSIANVSVAAICQGDWELLGRLMKKDLFHQPYRKKLIPHYNKVETLLAEHAYGIYLSGAGPTMIALTTEEKIATKVATWKETIQDIEWKILKPVNKGIEVIL